MFITFCAGVPAQDYQYDEDYEYDGEDTNYDDEIPKPNQKVPYVKLARVSWFFLCQNRASKAVLWIRIRIRIRK